MPNCLIYNNASRASIDKSKVYAHGGFKVVYKGVYLEGHRAGQECVTKEMRSGPAWLKSVFETELDVVEQTAIIIDKFNEAEHIDKPIMLVQPSIWEWGNNGKNDDGALNLTEPLLDNFQKFNSNTGWTPKHQRGWTQGAIYDRSVVLTDPVVHSRDGRFGATDMGIAGIQNFFHRHHCNDYCSCGWTQPKKTHSYFPLRSGTSMIGRDGRWIMPTRKTKPPLNI